MNMDNDKIWEIIERVQNNTSSEDDRIIYENWLNESEENRRLSALLMRVEYKMPGNEAEIKTNAYKKIQSVVQEEKNIRRLKIWRYSAVASIALLIAVSVFMFSNRTQSHTDEIFLETQVPYGQRTKITLADNTVVFLNAGSYLKYPPRFVGKTRKVTLIGEAYFEVAKNAEHPFIVEAGSLDIKVYGTHFSIKAYPEEDIVETTLVEGSVGLCGPDGRAEMVRLKPNQKALFNRHTNKIQLQTVNAILETSWKDGRYYFKKETLPVIARKLERNFNIPIRIVSPGLNNRVYAGLFDKNKTIYQIMDLITRHNDFTYRLKNDTIVIYSLTEKQQN